MIEPPYPTLELDNVEWIDIFVMWAEPLFLLWTCESLGVDLSIAVVTASFLTASSSDC